MPCCGCIPKIVTSPDPALPTNFRVDIGLFSGAGDRDQITLKAKEGRVIRGNTRVIKRLITTDEIIEMV